MVTQNHSWTPQRAYPEARRSSRYKLETEIRVYSRTNGRVDGHTVDISESGVGALLKLGVPLGQIVQLEFRLPYGPVAALALVRHQSAFRFGFEFVDPEPLAAVKDTCKYLALQQSLNK